jgi:hypothetical protein
MQQSSPAQINSTANFHIYESTGLEFRLGSLQRNQYAAVRPAKQRDGVQPVQAGNPSGFAAITSTRNYQRQVQPALKLTF